MTGKHCNDDLPEPVRKACSSGPGDSPKLLKAGRIAVCLLAVALLYGCSLIRDSEPGDSCPTGRERVLRALDPSNLSVNVLGRSGLISTTLPSSSPNPLSPFKQLDPDGVPGGRAFTMRLADNTIVGGQLFEYDDGTFDPKPLIMASFGFLQDRWGTEAAKVYELYLSKPSGRIPAHVLILDHPSTGTFLANNGCLSVGSYDDARMWIEIARKLRKDMSLSGIHLLGVSMSGQTVVHALIEDKRLGLGLFASGMAISIAPDFQKAPGGQLAQMRTPRGVGNPWADYFRTVPEKSFVDRVSSLGLCMMIDKLFVPHYHRINPTDTEFDLECDDVPVFLRNAFETRITLLREHRPDTWNAEFSLDSLDAFMSSTRIAGVIGRVRTPLVMVSASDDPAVDRAMFEEVMLAAEGNQWIAAFETDQGGHFGFNLPYGRNYLGGIVRLMIDPQVLVCMEWTR
jgi:hypothetical protein